MFLIVQVHAVLTCNLSIPGIASVQSSTLLNELRSGGSMNRPIYSPTAHQPIVGRIYDSIDFKGCNITLENADFSIQFWFYWPFCFHLLHNEIGSRRYSLKQTKSMFFFITFKLKVDAVSKTI